MATAISSTVNRHRSINAIKATMGVDSVVIVAVETRVISMCPAVRLAVNRTASATGRISTLIVSIIIRIGIRKLGVPAGSMWASACDGWLRSPIKTVASHNGSARPKLRASWVVGVNVYGSKPKRLINSR